MAEMDSDSPRAAPGSVIVFAHGAIVNGWEMGLLRRRMRRLGYGVRQFYWQSMRVGLNENVARLGKFIGQTEAETVHVVGHSMGGVLARLLFERLPDPRPGRLVAIGSPLVDCWVGRRYLRWHEKIGARCIGRSVHDHISAEIDPVWRGARDFGVLAGTWPLGAGNLFYDLPAPSDGVVLVEETRLRGITDHVESRLNHFGMLYSQRCAGAIARFLARGRF